jgi:hypothetical protein
MFRFDAICFTKCLFISPDLDGYRAPKVKHDTPRTIGFTICLFISPDLDGHRASKMKYYPCTICLFISPDHGDIDGHRTQNGADRDTYGPETQKVQT